jgi:hypothetical protein
MSKLSPVSSGQPTQGVGNAPDKASQAVAELHSVAAVLDPPTALIKPHGPVAAATVRAAAWLSLEAKEIEVRQYFKSIPVPSGLEMLARMRKQCDIAATELQQRMDEGNTERCTGCGKTLEEVRKAQWVMMGSDMDPDTGVPVPYRFCGPLCVRERNRKNMLPKELRDQKRFDGEEMGDVR